MELILGSIFFENYYSLFSVNTTNPQIGLVAVHYTDKGKMPPGPVVFLVGLAVIALGGLIGFLQVVREKKRQQVLVDKQKQDMKKQYSPNTLAKLRLLGLDDTATDH